MTFNQVKNGIEEFFNQKAPSSMCIHNKVQTTGYTLEE